MSGRSGGRAGSYNIASGHGKADGSKTFERELAGHAFHGGDQALSSVEASRPIDTVAFRRLSEGPCPSRRDVARPLDSDIINPADRHALRGAALHEDDFEPRLFDHSPECFRRGASPVFL
jgi:hypothetical protein